MIRRTPLLALAAAALATLALAACGSSSSSSTSSGSSSSSSATGSSKGTIKIGTICSCSGFAASNLQLLPQFAQAWTKYVNANGGINGHPVQVYLKDDAGDAGKALQGAKALVEQDHVMAIAGEISNQDGAFQPYVQQVGVPVIGGNSTAAPYSSSADFFPTGTTSVPFVFYAPGNAAKAEGYTKMGVFYCAEAPVCATIPGPMSGALKNAVGGMSVAFSGKIAATAPTYTAPCLGAKQAGANVLFIIQTVAAIVRMIDDCATQGYKPAEVNVGTNVGAPVLADANANGMSVVVTNLPISDTSTPAGKLFHQIINQYAPSMNSSPALTENVVQMFSGLQMFKLVATQEKLTPSSTPAQVKAGLYTVKNETLGGLTPPITYTNNGKPATVNCWFSEKIVNHKYTLPNGVATQCVPADKVAVLYKAVAG